MFWIILGVITIVISFKFLKISEGLSALLLFLIAFLFFPFSGFITYPSLVGEQAEVQALQSEINTIKNAYYKENSSGTLVGGSLTNIQQSKTLSEYISKYAVKKADYNSELEKTQTMKRMKIFFWFGDSAFVSNKVLELERL